MRLKKREDYIKALMKYHKRYYTDGGFPSIFSLQKKMLEMGICPRCGEPSRCYSSGTGHFPCWECDFKITPLEVEKVVYSDSLNRRILKRRLRK